MNMPPDYLQPLLFSIEQAVITTFREHTRLADKDVEWVYEQLKAYFQQVAQGRDVPDPSSTSSSREALIQAIFDVLDIREEIGADDQWIMSPDAQPGGRPIASLEMLYVNGLNYLLRSVRLWRKATGRTGYLRFLEDQLGKSR